MVMIDLRKPPVLVLATNPWLSGKLAKAAKEAGVNVRKFWYFRNPPPWSRYREYLAAMSPAQREVIERFRAVAKETAGMPIAERIRIIRERLSKKAVVTARAKI